jgi:YegS/Rv2252/BmrU family lipid kinase
VRTAAIVVNPIAGSRARVRALDAFCAALREGGMDVRVRHTTRVGEGALLAEEEARAGADFVVAAGGDGTVNDVAAGLANVPSARAALAILPRGTSNLVARDLGLPFRATDTARIVLEGRTAPMDLGVVNGRVFVACVGVGWDAHVVRLLAKARRGHITFSTWTGPIARAAVGYEFRPLRVSIPGGASAEGEFAIVLNTRPYAAFFQPVPGARRDDGLLDALVLRKGGLLDLPRWAWKARFGALDKDGSATHLRAAAFRVEADTPLPVQIDGDVGGETPLDILVRPAAVRVVVPAATGEG